ncbi:hypothetical protein OG390_08890 [Streptomyces sp. NBC_00996]|nr:hypothetical protein OG390_08890 [Streptomyces sp. NBC_00996]
MTPTYSGTVRRRRIIVPAPAESVRQGPAPAQDPPIYRALMRTWADRGRTLPGRHDPEWVRLAAPSPIYGYGEFIIGRGPRSEGQFDTSRDPRGDGPLGAGPDPRSAGPLSASRDPRGDGR